MPIPQDPDQPLAQGHLPPQPLAASEQDMRRRSEESIRTEDCEGPISDTPMENTSPSKEKNEAASGNAEAFCSNRAELIERLKRGESPNWLPNQSVSRRTSCLGFASSLVSMHRLHGAILGLQGPLAVENGRLGHSEPSMR